MSASAGGASMVAEGKIAHASGHARANDAQKIPPPKRGHRVHESCRMDQRQEAGSSSELTVLDVQVQPVSWPLVALVTLFGAS